MRICGVEIKGSEAIIALLELNDGLFMVPDCRARKISLVLPDDSESLQAFQFKFKQLMMDYKVDKVVIKSRPTKGKFAGGAVGFKLESAIQLLDNVDTVVYASHEINASIKRTPMQVNGKDAGLKGFQEQAYAAAYAYLVKPSEAQLLAEKKKADKNDEADTAEEFVPQPSPKKNSVWGD